MKRMELVRKILNDKEGKIKAFLKLIEILPFKIFLQLIREVRRQRNFLIEKFKSSEVRIELTSRYNWKGIDIDIGVFSIETVRKRGKKVIWKIWNTSRNVRLLNFLPYIEFKFLELKEENGESHVIEIGNKSEIKKYDRGILDFSVDIHEIIKRKKEIFSEFFSSVENKDNQYFIGFLRKIKVKVNIIDFCYLSDSQFKRLLSWAKEFIENNKEKGSVFTFQLGTNKINDYSYFSLHKDKNCVQIIINKDFCRIYHYYTDFLSNYNFFQKYLERNPLQIAVTTYNTVWNLELNLKEEK